MVEISRNAHGIEGLHLATECFTEEVEKRIFSSGYMGSEDIGKRTGKASGPMKWPCDYNKLANLIRDCGLLPGYVPPDYCFRVVYPIGAGFGHHYDSRHRWGEVIVGVTLGQSGVVYFVPKDGQESLLPPGKDSIRVALPRRSIYVMSGASRYDWKHGIVKHQPIHPPPPWNTRNLRISLTFRSKKIFSDVYLERQLQNETDMKKRAELNARISAQKQFYAVLGYNDPRVTKGEEEEQRRKANKLLDMMDSDVIQAQLRFRQHEVTFPLPISYKSNKYENSSNAASALAPAAVFPGSGRLLGSADDEEMKSAIDASLRSFAKEQAARRRKNDHSSRSSDEGMIVLSSDDDEDQKKESPICKKKRPNEVIVIDN